MPNETKLVAKIADWVHQHPRLASWLFLAAGMITMVALAARGRDLTAGQFASLLIATAGLAALCVWIISWE